VIFPDLLSSSGKRARTIVSVLLLFAKANLADRLPEGFDELKVKSSV